MAALPHLLIIGAQGQVGQHLCHSLHPLGQVTAWSRQDIDLENLDALRQGLHQCSPDVVVNAAAYTAVDRAETDARTAHTINAGAPAIIAEVVASTGSTLVHLSTDYVFDGHQSHPYAETDATGPLGVYGSTKLAGEAAIQARCDRNIILRTAWVYGNYGKGNFVKTMLRLGAERETLNIVCDQIGSPTWAQDIADTIALLLHDHILIADPHPSVYGTYHFTNSGVASWYDFAIAIFNEARQLGIPLTVQQVNPIPTSAYPTPAHRPAYSVLNCQKIQQLLKQPPPHWQHSLQQMLQRHNSLCM